MLELIQNNAKNLAEDMNEHPRMPKKFINGIEGIRDDLKDILDNN